MAAYVITPSGDVHVYAGANYAVRSEHVTELYESSKKERWIADIPKAWAVGWARRPMHSACEQRHECRTPIASAAPSAARGARTHI